MSVLMLPIIGVLGAGYDFMSVTTQSIKLRTTLESATLAAATLSNTSDIEGVVADYVDSNVALDANLRRSLRYKTEDISPPDDINTRTVKVTASASFVTTFLKIFNIRELPVEVETTASQAAGNLEISMVLDISASMNGAKFRNMKTAAKEFVTTIINDSAEDTVSINMIPFAGTVNVGPDMFNRFVVRRSRAITRPPRTVYRSFSGGRRDVATARFRFGRPTQCLEYASRDYGINLLPLASRSQFPDFLQRNGRYTYCPDNDNSILFNSKSESDLHDKIDDFSLAFGTGMDVGALWGLKALSPSFRGILGGDFSQRPAAFDVRETTKVMVIMTDGAITGQKRPRDLNNFRLGTVNVLRKGSLGSSSASNDSIGHFRKICESAKDQGIIVYTIGFRISSGSEPDQLLSECASDLDKYYLIDSLDVGEAFKAITTSLSKLRIIG